MRPVKSWRLQVVIKANIRPGSLAALDPLVLHGQTIIAGGAYYIKDVTHTYTNNKRMTSLSLAERYTAPRPPDDGQAIARKLEGVDENFRHANAASSTSSGPLQYHDDLLGRTDPQNHSQYLLANGGRLLTGNMPVVDGVKIDGVDISAHANTPNAHHNWPLAEGDIPVDIARSADLHDAATLAPGSDPILTLNGQQFLLGDVTTQAEFDSLVNQDLRMEASPTFADLNLTGGLLLTDRATGTLYRLFVEYQKVWLEEVTN